MERESVIRGVAAVEVVGEHVRLTWGATERGRVAVIFIENRPLRAAGQLIALAAGSRSAVAHLHADYVDFGGNRIDDVIARHRSINRVGELDNGQVVSDVEEIAVVAWMNRERCAVDQDIPSRQFPRRFDLAGDQSAAAVRQAVGRRQDVLTARQQRPGASKRAVATGDDQIGHAVNV